MPSVNLPALSQSKRLLVVTSLANAEAAATEEERRHHLEIARLAAR